MKRRNASALATGLVLAGCLAGALGCAVFAPPVARRVDGVTSVGRFIEPDAYALYALAALHEARGQWDEALELYRRALDIDDDGPEVRTRIGAVACRLRRNDIADAAFGAAAQAAPDYGPLWYELAQCRKSRADLVGALAAALEAVRLDPERYEASLLAADLAELRGDRTLAWQLRDGLASHAHDSAIVQRLILAAAERSRDRVRAARAQAALSDLKIHGTGARLASGASPALAALERGDLTTAKRESDRLLGADPGNGDALVIALAAADLEQDHAAFNALLEQSADGGTAASPLVLSTLAALLGRRVSAQAAQLVRPQP